jgi:hypothetical protein
MRPIFGNEVDRSIQLSARQRSNLMRWTTPDGIDVPSSGR